MSVDVLIQLHPNSRKPPCHFPARVQKLKDEEHVPISRSNDASVDIKTETRTVDEYIQKNNLKMPREERKCLFKLVNKYSEDLMKKHSNLNRISVSPVLSTKNGIEVKPCIVMYCPFKGNYPHDEPDFPRELEKVPVDVREGYCSLFGVSEAKDYNDPLRTGINIGSHGMKESGTLGPFVVEAENKTSVGFLTCQHVFKSAKIGINVVQPSVKQYKAGTNPDTICGKIKSMCLEVVTFNGKPTSVDVAYVALDKRIPKEFEFPDIPESVKDFPGNLRMGQPTMYLEEDDIGIRVYKLGQKTGLTEGSFDTMRDTVYFKGEKEKVQNVYQVSSDKKFAKRGDSGSSVFTVKGNTLSVIGVLLGGDNKTKEYYVIPIGAALQALQPKLEIYQFADETTTCAKDPHDDHHSNGAIASLSHP